MHIIKCLTSVALSLGIVGFAVGSLVSSRALFAPEGSPIALESTDDPVRNGMQILDKRPPDVARLQRVTNDDPAVILFENGIFTAKGKPSPYQ